MICKHTHKPLTMEDRLNVEHTAIRMAATGTQIMGCQMAFELYRQVFVHLLAHMIDSGAIRLDTVLDDLVEKTHLEVATQRRALQGRSLYERLMQAMREAGVELPSTFVEPPAKEEPRERCTLCNGLGILNDPQHGHALRCHQCAGTGFTQKVEMH